MIPPSPRSSLTDTPCPFTSLFRSGQLVSRDLRLDRLGALVADDLADLLGVLLRDALFERRDDAELLAARRRLTRVEALQGDAALDELGLEDVENRLRALFAVRLDQDRLAAPLDGCASRSEEHTSELQSLMRTSYAV